MAGGQLCEPLDHGQRHCGRLLRVCGVRVEWLSVATSDSGSYRINHVLDCFEKTLALSQHMFAAF